MTHPTTATICPPAWRRTSATAAAAAATATFLPQAQVRPAHASASLPSATRRTAARATAARAAATAAATAAAAATTPASPSSRPRHRHRFGLSLLSVLSFLLVLSSGLASSQECQADGSGEGCKPPAPAPAPSPKGVTLDILGLDEAKAVFKEAIITPATVDASILQVFPRSVSLSAVLLLGPVGMGKASLVDSTARELGAEVIRVQASAHALGACHKWAASSSRTVLVHLEDLERHPSLALDVPQCLRAASSAKASRLFLVATASRHRGFFSSSELASFGYLATAALPLETQRKEYLLRLLQQISRLDARWGAALREAEVDTLASLTSNFSFAEMELVVRRAFLRSVTPDGQDVVALHHFEKIIAETSAEAAKAFDEPRLLPTSLPADSNEASPAPSAPAAAGKSKKEDKKKGKGSKDPMEGIFGWCNFWLPEPLHLPPVVWAMILFGILAHFMARSMYQPYGQRKRRNGGPGGPGNPRGSSLFGDLGGAGGLGAGMGAGLGAGLGAGMGGMGAGLGAGASQFPGLNSDNLSDWPFPASMGRGDAGLFPGGGPTSTPSPPATSSTARPDSSSQ